MYLVDTNVWLERLLNQDKSDEVGRFLEHVPASELNVTDFTFHSICIILTRLSRGEVLVDFVQDLFVDGAVNLVTVKPRDMRGLVETMGKLTLDFDDAYQYFAAQENALTLVSFDGDFDRTDTGRKTPGEVLRERRKGNAESSEDYRD